MLFQKNIFLPKITSLHLYFFLSYHLSENKVLENHSVKSYFLQIAVGMGKVGSWLMTANHRWKQELKSHSVHSTGCGKFCWVQLLLKE